jgi:hypothetical protein
MGLRGNRVWSRRSVISLAPRESNSIRTPRGNHRTELFCPLICYGVHSFNAQMA